jgi:hypothetical protein
MRFRILIPAFIALASGPLYAQRQMDEDGRKEAHRTILRRFSRTEKAKTAELGLPDAAASFVDLYLDAKRNLREVRAGRAPKSRRFMGTAHSGWKPGESSFTFSASFVVFVIDSVTVPYAQVPALLDAALKEGFVKAVSVESDGDGGVGTWDLVLVSDLMTRVCKGRAHFENAGEAWTKRVEAALQAVVKRLDDLGPRDRHAPLAFLKAFGGEATAEALVEKAGAVPPEDPVRATLIRTVCGMDTKASAAFFEEILKGDDPAAKGAALSGASAFDKKTLALAGAILDPDSKEPEAVRRACVQALERSRSGAALDLLETAFASMKTGALKLDAGIALARSGREVSVSYLKQKLAEFEKTPDDRNARGRAAFLRRLLKDLEKKK